MAFVAVQLRPGVDTQLTMASNSAGITASQLIRYKEALVQTYGGWQTYGSITVPSTVRDLHAWQDITARKFLGIGATANLIALSSIYNDITPQTNTTNNPPNISISSGSSIATVVDGGSSATVFDTIYFNTPIAIGGILLNGPYKVNSFGGSSIYTISMNSVSTATVASSGKLPTFSTSSGNGAVTVTLSNNNFQAITGLFQQFIAATSVGGLTIQGKYTIASVIDSTTFTINAPTQATSAASSSPMNGGNAQILYYITLGPQVVGSGFGSGGFGSGGFGSGTATTGTPGTNITATDWSLDNWGEILLSCPANGPIFSWSPDSGFYNSQVITQAPFFNGGIFISQPQQILVAWRSVQSSGVQNALLVRWCNAGDYTNWTVSSQTTAGSFTIPTGSIIVGGMQGATQGIISTDVDVWIMQYVGGQVTFNFTRVGSGCGWIGQHACGVFNGNFYWCGLNNFYTLGSGGVVPMPCTVWDQIFQNMSAANQSKVKCAVNSAFSEITWFYPSATSSGENDSYVKVHIEGQEYEWDYGVLSRTAWIDISIIGTPIGTDSNGTIYQHESGNTIAGAGLPSFQTGWWTIGEGQQFAFVDQVIPDFIWGTRSGAQDAQVAITFFSAEYQDGPQYTYGPYIVTQSTPYINVRIRGRMMSMLVQANADSGFFRLGRIRYRVAPMGRR